MGPSHRMFAERTVCVGKEYVFVFAGRSVCMCVFVFAECGGGAAKVARLSLRDQDDRQPLI